MKTISAVVLVSALALAGCADDADEAIEEADPGIEAEIDPPAESTAPIVGDDAIVPEGTTEECFQAVAAAGDGTEVEGFGDDAEPLWPAFDACTSIEEFSAATESVSGVLGEEDPQTYVSELCGRIDEISGSALCLEVAGG